MAITGVRKSFFAKYAKGTGNTYGYSGGGALARLTSVSTSYETNDAELYSDDELEESDYTFSSGTLTIGTSDLTDAAISAILGITPTTGENGGELVYDDSMAQPELGVGFIITKRKAGVYSYRAVIFPRVKFKIPADAATTREGKLSFQTSTIEGTIARDFSEKHVWKREQTFSDESDAVEYIQGKLNITNS